MAQALPFPPKPPSMRILDELHRNDVGSTYRCQIDGEPRTVRWVKRATWEPILLHAKDADQEGSAMSKFKSIWEKFKENEHHNLVGVRDVFCDKGTGDLLLVSDCVGESLEMTVSRNISKQRTNELCLGVARAIRHLHESVNEFHGCITLDDMFVSEEGIVQVGGLDASCLLRAAPDALAKVNAASPYCPLGGESKSTCENDVFSMGVVVLEILTGQRCGRIERELPDAGVQEGLVEIERRRFLLDRLEEQHPLKSMILDCLHDKPPRRPTMLEVYGATLVHCEKMPELQNVYNLEFQLQNVYNLEFQKPDESKVLMVSLDGAGKTTLLYKLKLDKFIQTIPTMGFNMETIPVGNDFSFVMWDVGGNEGLRPLWKHYYAGIDALVFVIDSTDMDRLETAKEVLYGTLGEEELANSPFLVLANKQDLPGAVSPSELEQLLDLSGRTNKNWRLCGVSAYSGEGLWSAIQELKDMVIDTRGNQ